MLQRYAYERPQGCLHCPVGRATPEAEAKGCYGQPPAPPSPADVATDSTPAADERVWLPFSQVGTCWGDAAASDGVKMQIGTFYQVMDSASLLQLPVRVGQWGRTAC